MLYIFDLDATVICSKHRQNTKTDGSLDLDKWRENSTPQKVKQDTLLPLAQRMRILHDSTVHKVAICTARVMSRADYDFLTEHNLLASYYMSRHESDVRTDHEMKYSKIWNLLHKLKIPRARWSAMVSIIDDNTNVLSMAENRLGIQAFNAIELNQRIKAAL